MMKRSKMFNELMVTGKWLNGEWDLEESRRKKVHKQGLVNGE